MNTLIYRICSMRIFNCHPSEITIRHFVVSAENAVVITAVTAAGDPEAAAHAAPLGAGLLSAAALLLAR